MPRWAVPVLRTSVCRGPNPNRLRHYTNNLSKLWCRLPATSSARCGSSKLKSKWPGIKKTTGPTSKTSTDRRYSRSLWRRMTRRFSWVRRRRMRRPDWAGRCLVWIGPIRGRWPLWIVLLWGIRNSLNYDFNFESKFCIFFDDGIWIGIFGDKIFRYSIKMKSEKREKWAVSGS